MTLKRSLSRFIGAADSTDIPLSAGLRLSPRYGIYGINCTPYGPSGYKDITYITSFTSRGIVPLLLSDAVPGSLSSVKLYGSTKQDGTPTPDDPVDIVCNNGVVKFGKNLIIDGARNYAYINTTGSWAWSNDSYSIALPVTVGKKYRIIISSTDSSIVGAIFRYGFTDSDPEEYKQSEVTPSPTSISIYDYWRGTPQDVSDVEVTATHPYLVIQFAAAYAATVVSTYLTVKDQIAYVYGTTETIQDSLSHTATAHNLLAVDTYKDVQEVLSGSVTRNVGIKVLDGTEEWTASGNLFYAGIATDALEDTHSCYCTHFKGVATNASASYQNEIKVGTNATQTVNWTRVQIYPVVGTFSDVAALKSWLAGQYANGTPVIVVYPLATPTTETVAGQTLQVQEGNNTLEVTQGSINELELEATYEMLEWKKPDSWPNIIQKAKDNSVYFLVAHSADYSEYNEFPLTCTTVNLGTFDVYIDNVKIYSAQPSSDSIPVTIDWQTLGLTTGYDITHPSDLRAHIVRVTPTNPDDQIRHIRCQHSSPRKEFGILWVHFALDYPIGINGLLGSWNGNKVNALCEIVTATDDKITLSTGYGIAGIFQNSGLQRMPLFVGSGVVYDIAAGLTVNNLKRLRLKDITSHNFCPSYAPYLKFIEADNCQLAYFNNTYRDCPVLENMPSDTSYYVTASGSDLSNLAKGAVHLRPISLDFSARSDLKGLRFGGTQSEPLIAIKGMKVSSSAPFDSTTSPQINVSYTGLTRTALVNLFNSMPYNVGYTVTGSPTITDGIVSGFSTDNYLTLDNIVPADAVCDIYLRIKTPAAKGFSVIVGSGGNNLQWISMVENSTKVAFRGGSHGGATTYVISDSLSLDTWYDLKFTIQAGQYTVLGVKTTSQSEYTYTTGNTIPGDTWFGGYNMSLGKSMSASYPRPFEGSIDLTHTYINVNGLPWFRGTAAMTKTCSVVGCTGTADLTADDKNIALNKGWALTVA